MRTALLSVLVVVGLAGSASADAVLVGHVTDLVGKPVAGARVHVLAGGVEQQIVVTDTDGNYRVVVDGNQEIQVVIGAGNLHTFRRGTIKDGTIRKLDVEVETAEGEIIRIIDDKPPAVPPKRPKEAVRKTPPYSEEAVERDAWAKAWLVLDVSETGKVLRVKLVKRPGFDLDEIAVKEGMKLVFEPARDEHGRPMRARILWSFEWPSHGWLIEHNGNALRLPDESYAINPLGRDFGNTPVGLDRLPSINRAQTAENNGPRLAADGSITPPRPRGGINSLNHTNDPRAALAIPSPLTGTGSLARVRCAGTGPLNLDERYPVYRDCSRPNLKKLPYLPWLDGTQPIPPDPPEIARKPEPPIHLTRASYIPQIVASAVSGGLVIAAVYAGLRVRHYQERLGVYSDFSRPEGPPPLDQYRREKYGLIRWQRLTVVGAVLTVASGVFTTGLWFRHQGRADFSVQPEDDGGASVTLGGQF